MAKVKGLETVFVMLFVTIASLRLKQILRRVLSKNASYLHKPYI